MNWLDDRLPLYAFSWMDSGTSYHFASYGAPGLAVFLSAIAVAILARSGWRPYGFRF